MAHPQFNEDEATAQIMLLRAVALAPEQVRAWEDLAALYTLHDPAARRHKTREAMRRALELEPENLFVLCLQLRVLDRQGSHRRAIRLARALVRRHPDLVEAVIILARVLAKEGRREIAILELRRFKERVSTPEPRYAAWLMAQADEAELAIAHPATR